MRMRINPEVEKYKQGVYLIGTQDFSRIKIGLTNNFVKRAKTLQYHNPYIMFFYGFIPDAGRKLEQELLDRFTKDYGECVTASVELKEYIKSLNFEPFPLLIQRPEKRVSNFHGFMPKALAAQLDELQSKLNLKSRNKLMNLALRLFIETYHSEKGQL